MARRKTDYLYAALTGVLLSLAFPPMPFFLFAFIAFVPLFKVLEDRNWERTNLLRYVAFFTYNALSNWWVGSWSSATDPYLMISGVAVVFGHPLFMLVPFWVFSLIRKKIGPGKAYWFFPLIWAAYEWAHGLSDLSYPWLSIGYSQMTSTYLAQVADVIGVYGIGFLIAIVNVLVFKANIVERQYRESTGKRELWFAVPSVRVYYSISIAIPLLMLGYGLIRINSYDHDKLMSKNPSMKIGVIQACVDPWDKWSSKTSDMIQHHFNVQDSLVKAVGKLDLTIWSETAITFLNLDFNFKHNFGPVKEKIDNDSMALLTGLTDIVFYTDKKSAPSTARDFMDNPKRPYDAFNSAMLLMPKQYDTLNPQIYHKMKLTPFSERLPFAELLFFAKSWFEWKVGISSWQKGERQFTLNMPMGKDTARIGSIICIESIYPDFVRNLPKQGANILVVITNDGWFDNTPGPRQHYEIAAMRAIETRRYVARCANTGISGFIAPTGKSLVELAPYKVIGKAAKLPLLEEKTFYVRNGDIIPKLSAIIIFVLFAYCLIPTKKTGQVE